MEYEFHDYADIFPLLRGEEFDELRSSIISDGLEVPIILYENKILDGRNRYIACMDAGVQPRFATYEGKDPIGHIIRLNLHRRHLTASQRAAAALDALPHFEAEAEKRRLARLSQYAADKELIPYREQEEGQARDQAGEMFGVSGRYISDAKNIRDGAPDLFEKVRTGEMPITRAKREVVKRERKEAPPLPLGIYNVLYADPPWEYGNSGIIGNDNYGRAQRHYPSMSISELCELGDAVKKLTANDAVLFLWVTSPMLEDCFKVINAWGFKYKTSFVWDKVKHNYGHYNSVRHELLLVCTKGSATPEISEKVNSVQRIERSSTHSEKPVEFRRIIERLYPSSSRLELFARQAAHGWDVWGNEK